MRETAEYAPPDAFVISLKPNQGDVLDQVLPELRDRSHSRHVPILVLYPSGGLFLQHAALNLGASEVACAGSSGEELALRLAGMLERKELRDRLRQTTERSYQMAATDPLTGLYNRRYAEAYLVDVIGRTEGSGRGFVVMMVDLDHFKAVNDTYGHAVGDQVLQTVAERIRDTFAPLILWHGWWRRIPGRPARHRWRGSRACCGPVAAALIADHHVPLADDVCVKVTASIGVATCQAETVLQSLRTAPLMCPKP